MPDDSDQLDGILDSMSRDEPIDWDSASEHAAENSRQRIETLRHIARIASFNRSLQADSMAREARRAAAPPPMPATWGDLVLLEWIDSGARADVFRAWDPGLHADVAVKLFRPDAPGAISEAAAGAALLVRHPNLVPIYGTARHDDRLGIWMELQVGPTLERLVNSGRQFSPHDVVRFGLEIGGAVMAVHDAGLLHGRIDPAHVFLGAGNEARILPMDVASNSAPKHSDLDALEALLRVVASAGPPIAVCLAAVLHRATEPAMEARYASIAELVHALEKCLTDLPAITPAAEGARDKPSFGRLGSWLPGRRRP